MLATFNALKPTESLARVAELCASIRHGRDSFVGLHTRLRCALDVLDAKKSHATDEQQFAVTLDELWRFLDAFHHMSLVEKLLNHGEMRTSIASANKELDKLASRLGVESSDWRKQYCRGMDEQQRGIEDLVMNPNTLEDDVVAVHEQQDALVQLRAALDKIIAKRTELPMSSQTAVKKAFRTLVSLFGPTVHATPSWFVLESDIHFSERPFASGAFGSVHRGELRDQTRVVVKMLLPDGRGLGTQLQNVVAREFDQWRTFNHPHVLRLVGACHVSKRPFVVVEEASQGSMVEYLNKSPSHKMQIWKLVYEAAQGLAYLHSKGVVHGSLRLDNILVNAGGRAVVSDFGLLRVKNRSKLKLTKKRKDGTLIEGGLRWDAPERSRCEPSYASDVYALGMCILKAFSGEPPYANFDDNVVRGMVAAGELPPRPRAIEDKAWDLVRAMARPDPSVRIRLADAIKALSELSKMIK